MKKRNNNNQYDERQLIERGKAFQQSFFILVIIMFINSILYGFVGIVWADYYYSQIIMIMVAITYGIIKMICKDAYNDINYSTINPALTVLGVAGLIGVWSNIMQMIRNNKGFIAKGQLTDNGAGIIMTGCMLSIGVVHLVKVLKDKKTDLDEDE